MVVTCLCLFVLLSVIHLCYCENITVVEDVVANAKLLATKYHNPNRTEAMNKVFTEAAGVYKNKKARKLNSRLQNTVLINVVESSGHRWNPTGQDKYKQLIHNHLCYGSLHEFESVVYIIDDNSTRFDAEVRELKTVNPLIHPVDYPYELFWSLVAKKTSDIKHGSGNVDYGGNMPSFKHFGFLVMLVPLLEALQAGFNVIYFDVDIALLRDPLPHMVYGTADLAVSIEKRTCVYPSLSENKAATDWSDVEPNTGTLFAQSNPRTLSLFQQWVDTIVQENTNNDQKALHFRQWGALQTFDCNPFAQRIYRNSSTSSSSGSSGGSSRGSSGDVSVNAGASYCFLNELLFQNGKLAFSCAFDRHGSRAEYLLGMAVMQSFNASDDADVSKGDPVDTLAELPRLRQQAKQQHQMNIAPVTVHANYCDNKKHMLGNLGLWLAEGFDSTSHCRPFNMSSTFFGKIDWVAETHRIQQELTAVRHMPNNTVFKFVHKPSVYLYDSGINVIRPFGSGEKFLSMGYEWKDVKNIKTQYSFFMNFTLGEPL